MANKPKISHFAPTDSTTSKTTKSNSPDRSSLAKLYREPKTYEQRKHDIRLLQQAYRLHWPKRPHLNVAVYGSLVFGCFIWFIQNLSDSWLGNSDKGLIMSTVFFTFALAIVIMFLIIAWVNYVNRLFSYFGGMIRVFWFVYTILAAVLLIPWLSGWIWEYTNILWIPVLTILHFIFVFFSTQRIIGRTL